MLDELNPLDIVDAGEIKPEDPTLEGNDVPVDGLA